MSNEEKDWKRGGRPKQEVLRDKFSGTWFTQQEYETVKQRAARAGMRLSVFLREVALKRGIVGRLTEEQNEQLKQLAGMGRNLNQMAHKGHAEGFLFALADFTSYRDKLTELIDKLSK